MAKREKRREEESQLIFPFYMHRIASPCAPSPSQSTHPILHIPSRARMPRLNSVISDYRKSSKLPTTLPLPYPYLLRPRPWGLFRAKRSEMTLNDGILVSTPLSSVSSSHIPRSTDGLQFFFAPVLISFGGVKSLTFICNLSEIAIYILHLSSRAVTCFRVLSPYLSSFVIRHSITFSIPSSCFVIPCLSPLFSFDFLSYVSHVVCPRAASRCTHASSHSLLIYSLHSPTHLNLSQIHRTLSHHPFYPLLVLYFSFVFFPVGISSLASKVWMDISFEYLVSFFLRFALAWAQFLSTPFPMFPISFLCTYVDIFSLSFFLSFFFFLVSLICMISVSVVCSNFSQVLVPKSTVVCLDPRLSSCRSVVITV